MPSLLRTDAKFRTPFEIIEGGSGTFFGILTEPGQGEVPSFQFNLPRRLLRVNPGLPLHEGMVIRNQSGAVFLLASHGSAEMGGSVLFKNFRLFECPRQFTWQSQEMTRDPITLLPTNNGLSNETLIWGVYEPGNQESFDRGFRSNFENGRFITNRKIALGDVVDGRRVSRVDEQLGIYLTVLG